jgi:hypothetical protein
MLGRVFYGTQIGELPHLKSYRLESGTLIYECADQQSGRQESSQSCQGGSQDKGQIGLESR